MSQGGWFELRNGASTIKPGINKAIITGTSLIIYYDGKGGVFNVKFGNLPSNDDISFWNDSLWCLFDAKAKTDFHLGEFPYGCCTFILSTSPRREMVNDFKKPPEPQIFYMPTWTEKELEAIASLFPNVHNEWRERFEILGGIPRHVLEVTTELPTVMLEAACKKCSLDDCIMAIGINSTITEGNKVVHLLIHITSTPPYTKSSVDYASKEARKIIVRNKGDEVKRKMNQLLATYKGVSMVAA
jgi:hypothetical protein